MSNFASGQTWIGNGNPGDWNDAANWNPGVPTGSTSDIIMDDPLTPGNYLIIDGTKACKSITFINDGLIDFDDPTDVLQVYEDIINNSNALSLEINPGIFEMKGTVDGVIDGSQDIYLNQLKINKTLAADIIDVNVSLSILQWVDAFKGELQSNGNLKLLANTGAPSTAFVEPNTNGLGSITGEVEVQQFIDLYTEYYHYLCSPVGESGSNTDYTIDGQFADNTSSISTSSYTYAWNNNSIPNFMLYREQTCSPYTAAQLVSLFAGQSITISTAQGEMVRTFYGWESSTGLSTQAIEPARGICSKVEFDYTSRTLNWFGTLNDGPITSIQMPLNVCNDDADGVALLGNPYASPLDWDVLYAHNSTLISPYAYIWTPDANASAPSGQSFAAGYYTVLDATYGTGTVTTPVWGEASGSLTNYIGIGQGFFVKTLSHLNTIDFDNTDRYSSQTPVLYRDQKPKDALQLTLKSKEGHDYINVYLGDQFHNAFNHTEDAVKLMNPGVNMYTTANLHNLMINRLKKGEDEIHVPLQISTLNAGDYLINIGAMPFESDEYTAFLQDKELTISKLITNDFNYPFKAQSGDNNDRFVIHFVKGHSISSNTEHDYKMFTSGTLLNIICPNNVTQSANILILDASGRKILDEQVNFVNTNAQVSLSGLNSGAYIVNLQTSDASVNEKIIIAE